MREWIKVMYNPLIQTKCILWANFLIHNVDFLLHILHSFCVWSISVDASGSPTSVEYALETHTEDPRGEFCLLLEFMHPSLTQWDSGWISALTAIPSSAWSLFSLFYPQFQSIKLHDLLHGFKIQKTVGLPNSSGTLERVCAVLLFVKPCFQWFLRTLKPKSKNSKNIFAFCKLPFFPFRQSVASTKNSCQDIYIYIIS